ncbi:DNRLRE domain-containing protein [Sulfidibacter corallicola]|uniref:DNRLRE domain-containing protein n=1 Tax=Sulfidibacter corallicola TaxID=2818388 RepID=A0A8A4TJ22_SULCO|nr:DNRLRE domain-containing protein [Sulfidibacter corallicola]QTD49194.1 DNRLRE domain-containing protein [Sulfidibacter corallicola]
MLPVSHHFPIAGVKLILCQVLLVAPLVGQIEITLTPSRDNTLYESPSGDLSNGAGDHFFAGTTNGGLVRRGLVAFDIAGNLPPGAQIQSVQLRMNVSRTVSGAVDVGLHRVTSDWGQGASDADGEEGGGATPQANDATWIHTFFPNQFWDNPGGDFAPTASSSIAVSGNGEYTWGSNPALVGDVQAWVDGGAPNFGWVLVGDESTSRTAKRFDSVENPTAAQRPQLTIVYDLQARIGLALDAAVTGLEEGAFGVTLAYRVVNRGDAPLEQIQVQNDLAQVFAGADFSLSQAPQSTRFSVNPGFDGDQDIDLLDGTDELPPGEEGSVVLELRVEPTGTQTLFSNSAQASATSSTGTFVSDTSQNGTDDDPDGNGNPGDNSEATLLVLANGVVPTLGTAGLLALIGGLVVLAVRQRKARR